MELSMPYFRFTSPAAYLLLLLTASTVNRLNGAEPAQDWQWYKGNLHTHSLWSDGNDYPEMICQWYKDQGYHFLALSDHNILSKGEKWMDHEVILKRGAVGGLEKYKARFGEKWVETRTVDEKLQVRLKTFDEFRPLLDVPGKFLLIQAEEISDKFDGKPIHLNASNVRDLILPQGGKTLRETIANNLIAVELQSRQAGQPMLAHLNHPNFGYAITAEDMAHVLEERYFEVYNGHGGVNHMGNAQRAPVERMWDIANTIRLAEMKGPPLFGLGTDDTHNYFSEKGSTPGRGWVMVRAKELTPAALIFAIKHGDFYASSGVELADVRFDAKARRIELEIVPQKGVEYVTQFIGTPKKYNKKSEPIRDKDGKEIVATRKYSADVGKVFAEVPGLKPTYTLTGDELYVRALVTASVAPKNPSYKDQKAQAWTQPVGWEPAEEPMPK
jgi:hypothetical protein